MPRGARFVWGAKFFFEKPILHSPFSILYFQAEDSSLSIGNVRQALLHFRTKTYNHLPAKEWRMENGEWRILAFSY
jgi:hypothetical protein